jgi:hypothetical protein
MDQVSHCYRKGCSHHLTAHKWIASVQRVFECSLCDCKQWLTPPKYRPINRRKAAKALLEGRQDSVNKIMEGLAELRAGR